MIESIYIHVPFCLERCAYCNFYSGESLAHLGEYPALLVEEMRLQREGSPLGPVATLYFGGGTPSLLGVGGVGRVIEGVARLVGLSNGAEVTVEVNPAAGLDFGALASAGVNRVSIGVQALDDTLLRMLGRVHDSELALETVRSAVGAGLRVSGDLIYGFAGLTGELLARSVEVLTGEGVEHLSAYSLEISSMCEDAPAVEPSSQEVEQLHWESIIESAARAGLRQYEVSNFCLPGCESRHNVNYWEGGGYLGLGPGARGFDPGKGKFGTRYSTVEELASWSDAIESGKLPPCEAEVLAEDEALLERLFLAFRRVAPLKSHKILDGTSYSKVRLDGLFGELVDERDLERIGEDIFPTQKGLRRGDGLAVWAMERLES